MHPTASRTPRLHSFRFWAIIGSRLHSKLAINSIYITRNQCVLSPPGATVNLVNSRPCVKALEINCIITDLKICINNIFLNHLALPFLICMFIKCTFNVLEKSPCSFSIKHFSHTNYFQQTFMTHFLSDKISTTLKMF